ncbi:hypothetical protein FA15DRAFT_711473 [Coprinopsis marcescibilis]|uniref:Uncharacterized protein n=1 Tax=Coprinopsis marcescibilis TaxID=230819 RepID=A0A5C3K9U9_COPMA|nr:hypothetical protein FA15DRAFT_711473 [Coprinopsis marcescibilis]
MRDVTPSVSGQPRPTLLSLTLEPETVEEDFKAATLALESVTSLLRMCNEYPDNYPLRDPLLIREALKDFAAALDLPAWQRVHCQSRASVSEDEDDTIRIPVAPRPTFAPRGPSPPRQSTLPCSSPPERDWMEEDNTTDAPPRPKEGQLSHPVSRPQPKKPVVPFQRPTPGPPPPVNRATRPLPQSSSYALAVRKAPAGPSLANLAKAAPNLTAKRLLEVQREAEGPSKKKKKTTSTLSFMSQGPSRKQVLVMFEGKAVPTGFPVNILMAGCNVALTRANGTTRVLASQLAYDGLSLSTTLVANPKDINIIHAKVLEVCPTSHKDKTWVGLPMSTSYLKVLNVPFYKNIADGTLATADDIANALKASPLAQNIYFTGQPRLVRNSKCSTTCTAYFNIWDSLAGTKAKTLIGRLVSMGGKTCQIQAAKANLGAALCQ